MLFLEEIVGVFVVDLHEGDVEPVVDLGAPLDLIEDEGQGSRDDSPELPGLSAAHGVSLARACLAVGEDGGVVALQETSLVLQETS